MFVCPNCGEPLEKVKGRAGLFWRCGACGGRAYSLATLRRALAQEFVNTLWQKAREISPKGKACPACGKATRAVPMEGPAERFLLDVCPVCRMVWFDPDEYSMTPSLPPVAPPSEMESAADRREHGEVLAEFAVAEHAGKKQERERLPEGASGEYWHIVPGLLGLPVEDEVDVVTHRPWGTWCLAGLIVLISVTAFQDLPGAISRLAFVPAQWDRLSGMTPFTSFFLHGGVMHLIGNVYFLVVLGDNVEDFLGTVRFVLLVALATLLGAFAHLSLDPGSLRPCIGASGGISGIMTFYALRFPMARLSLFVAAYYRVGWVRLPAIVFFFLWVLYQLFGAVQQWEGYADVSYAAHLGGSVMGLVFWIVWSWGSGE